MHDVAALQMQLERRRGELHARQVLAQQQLQMGCVARRFGQRDLEARRRLRRAALPRLVPQAQRAAAHACPRRLRPRHQALQQHAGAVHELRTRVGALPQLEPALEDGRRHDPAARIGGGAERAVELVEQRRAETARQPGARQAQQIADAAQPHALQCVPVLPARAEQVHRQIGQPPAQRRLVGAMQRLGRCRRRIAVQADAARQPVRRLRRRRAGDADTVAERRERSAQALQQPLAPAEAAQAGLHFHQHQRPIGRRQRDGRGEGQRRMRHAGQRLRVALRVGLADAQLRRQRERRRAAHAGPDAEVLCSGAGLHNAQVVEQRQRLDPRFGRQRCRKGFQRQCGQVQADPQHGERPIAIVKRCAPARPARPRAPPATRPPAPAGRPAATA